MDRNTYESLLYTIKSYHDEICERMLRANNIIYNKINSLTELVARITATNNTAAGASDVPVLDLRQRATAKPTPQPTQKWYTVNRKGRTIPVQNEQFHVPLSNRFEVLDTEKKGNESFYFSEYNNITFVNDSVLNAPQDHSLAHCVSRDLHCGAGYAKYLKMIYGGRGGMDILKSQNRNVGEVAALPIDGQQFLLNLVTKELYHGKPTMRDIELSLWSLKRFCQEYRIHNLAMPLIACGLDKRPWSEVQKLIEKVFGDSVVNIKIYTSKETDIEKPVPRVTVPRVSRPKSPKPKQHMQEQKPKTPGIHTPTSTMSSVSTTSPILTTSIHTPTSTISSVSSTSPTTTTPPTSPSNMLDDSDTMVDGDEAVTILDEDVTENAEAHEDVSERDVAHEDVSDGDVAHQNVADVDEALNDVTEGDVTAFPLDDDVGEAPATTGDTPRRSPALATPHEVESPRHGVSPASKSSGESCVITPTSNLIRFTPLISGNSRCSTRCEDTTTPRILFLTQSSEDLLARLEQSEHHLPEPTQEPTLVTSSTLTTPTNMTAPLKSPISLRRSTRRVTKSTQSTQNFHQTKVHHVNVLFIDNPVGTGYSHVDTLTLLTKNNKEIADDLVTFTKAFYTSHPEFETTPLAIFGESYGGKMDIEFALELDKAIKAGELVANLKAVAIGDGWVSPIDSTTTWAPFLWHTGVVDTDGFNRIDAKAQECQLAVDEGRWDDATQLWSDTEVAVMIASDNVDFYNILYRTKPLPFESDQPKENNRRAAYRRNVQPFDQLTDLMNGPIRDKLITTTPDLEVWDQQGADVFDALWTDFMKPAINIVEELLNTTTIDVVVYNGQLDLIVDTPGQIVWTEKLYWTDRAGWYAANRQSLTVNGFTEGYLKEYNHFRWFWIDRAGHMVPKDNPNMGIKLVRDVTGLPPIN